MTHDQYIASDPAISAWVSASAGTGKTKVLSDRVLRLLLAGNAPQKILCITYTKAASAEMKQRIEERLGHWAIAEDGALRESLKELTGQAPSAQTLTRARQLFALVLDAPVGIRIQTIHGFCQSVLKRFPLEAGIPPHFTLIEERTSQELLLQARARLFTQPHDPAATQAIATLAALINETAFNDLIADIVHNRRRFLSESPSRLRDGLGEGESKQESPPVSPRKRGEDSIDLVTNRIYSLLGIAPGTSAERLVDEYFHYTEEELQSLRLACAALAQGKGDSDGKTLARLESWLADRRDYESYLLTFLTKENEPRKLLCTKTAEKKWPPLKETLLAEQRRVCAFADKWKSLRIAQVTLHVLTFARCLLDLYRDQKQQHGYMDYDDLILSTLELLQREGVAPWVLYKLDGGIDHLLVDEAQDTSPEQWHIVTLLAGEFFSGESAGKEGRTLFVVGDEKQSIFSFQGAKPLEFDAQQHAWARKITAAAAEFKRVRLALSFRSTAPVLDVVDAVFAQPDAREGLVFSEQDISHTVHRAGMAGRVEFWPLVEAPEVPEREPWHIAHKAHYAQRPEVMCADTIAGTIALWLKEKRTLASQGRAVRPGDILILVQRRSFFARAMLRALRQRGIAVAGADRLVLSEHIAVEDCMTLGEFLLLPHDDLALATVLKSPFIGLTEEELFELAYGRGRESLWQRLKANKKYHAAYDFLSDLLSKVDYHTPFELFAYLFESCGGRRKLAARLGAEIEDPINEFLSLALQYEQLHPPSLQGFLHWMQTGSTEIKRDMEKGRDEIRIMTVHGAKGLQAPIVFIPDATRMPRYDSGLIWDEASAVPLWSPFSDYDDAHYRRLKEARRAGIESEYRRLLYVAMTRAEDELYICGWKGSRPLSEKCWYELLRRGIAAKWELTEDRWVHTSAQTAQPRTKIQPEKRSEAVELPQWSKNPPADEPLLPRPLTPSRMGRAGGQAPVYDPVARERGLLIHRLLQYLPNLAQDARTQTMQNFITRYGGMLSAVQQREIAAEVNGILQHADFAPVFGPDSVAEAPVSGIITDSAGRPLVISGQIDRLAVVGDDVYIIDYKTNRDVPKHESQTPGAYLRQMASYRELVARIYPQKSIRCGLLWTMEPKLMMLSNAIFESLAA